MGSYNLKHYNPGKHKQQTQNSEQKMIIYTTETVCKTYCQTRRENNMTFFQVQSHSISAVRRCSTKLVL